MPKSAGWVGMGKTLALLFWVTSNISVNYLQAQGHPLILTCFNYVKSQNNNLVFAM